MSQRNNMNRLDKEFFDFEGKLDLKNISSKIETNLGERKKSNQDKSGKNSALLRTDKFHRHKHGVKKMNFVGVNSDEIINPQPEHRQNKSQDNANKVLTQQQFQ